MEEFERNIWKKSVREIPALNTEMNGIIARTLILTKGNFEEVEFVTGTSRNDIFKVYQWMEEKGLVSSITIKEKNNKYMVNNDENQHVGKRKQKDRTFTREEMVGFAKKKLFKSNSEIEFIGLKHNILTCKFKDETIKVYISSSRDYEFMRKAKELNPFRLSAWNKGTSSTFNSYDYYAFLVKADDITEYNTESDENIEGLFVSQAELNNWLDKKESQPSGMVNFYIHYVQTPGSGRGIIKVVDDREEPPLLLDYLYQLGWKLR